MPVKNLQCISPAHVRNLITAKDWNSTDLGHPEHWPASLCANVSLILDHPVPMCIIWGSNFSMIYNERFAQLLGLAHPGALGAPASSIFSADWAMLEPQLMDAFLGNSVEIAGLRLQIANRLDLPAYMDFACSPVREHDGGVAGVLISVTLKSAKVHVQASEEKEREDEKQFTALANNIQNLAWMATPEGWIYWYNDRWYEYTGTTPGEMEGWGWTSVHDPEYLPKVIESWQHSIKSGERFEMVFPLKGADNIYRPFLTLVFPLRDRSGNIVRWIGTNTDISKQKEAEEQFRQMAERMPQKIWTSDPHGNRTYFNQTMLDYTGLAFKDLEGWGWKRIIHPDDWDQTKERLDHSIKTGEDYHTRNRLLRRDGKYLWHIVRAIPIKNENGTVKMWIGTNTEIHDQVELSEYLQKNLSERENRIQTILQHAPDAIISIDDEGFITSWNSEATKVFGWNEIEAVGKTLTSTIIPRRYHAGHDNGMKHFLSTGEGPVINRPVEVVATKKDGAEIPVELKISTSRMDGRHIFIGFIRDISLRKQAEEIIRNKTNQLIEAQELAHIGSWEWDVRHDRIEWSDELFRIFGLEPQEFVATYESYLNYIHEDDRELVNGIVTQALSDRMPFQFFHKVLRRDGSVRIISASGRVFTDKAGDILRMTGTAQDVTNQKRYEEELKLSEERFLKIFHNNPVPMTLSEVKSNKIRFANNLFYNTFGYDSTEVLGHSAEELELIDPEEYQHVVGRIFGYIGEQRSLDEVQALSRDETEVLLLKLKQVEQMKDFEILYTRKNGQKFPAIVSFEVIRIGAESYIVTSYQDITERKKIEERLRIQNEQLDQANKELESFAYVSSHDLQEPLRKIQTFVSLIEETEAGNLSDYGLDKFRKIQASASRMQTLIKDLLAFSSTASSERKFEAVDLMDLIEEVKDDLSLEISQKNAKIEIGEACTAKLIPFQFRQLMSNLIGNALKFSKSDVAPSIKINCVIDKGKKFDFKKLSPELAYCHITVEDNGIGFSQDQNERIFDVFQRLHGRDQYTGTGIGLAIVKKIVENHDGFISAQGVPGIGATFHVYVPCKPEV